jgi:lipopolysaccharide export LptBFGC system permease protein LptF
MNRPASFFSVTIFGAIALLHALRMVFKVQLAIGGVEIPIWVSVVPVLFFGSLGAWLWTEREA